MAQLISDYTIQLFRTFISSQYEEPSTISFNDDALEAVFLTSYSPLDTDELGSAAYLSGNIVTRQDLHNVSSYRTYSREVVLADSLEFLGGQSPILTGTAIIVIQRKSDTKLVAFIEVPLDNALDTQYLTWKPSRTLIDYDIPCGLAEDTRDAGVAVTGVSTTAIPLPEQSLGIEDYVTAPSTDISSDMGDNLIWQFRDLTTIDSLLKIPADELTLIASDITDIQSSVDLATSQGHLLDTMGSWIGRTRILNQTDEDYRYDIYLKTLENVNDGTLSSVTDIINKSLIRSNLAGSIQVIDDYPAGVKLEYSDISLLDIQSIRSVDRLLPAGVGVSYAYLGGSNCFVCEGGEGLGLDSIAVTIAGDGNHEMLTLVDGQYLFTEGLELDTGTYSIQVNTTNDGTLLNHGPLHVFIELGLLRVEYLTTSFTGVNVADSNTHEIGVTLGPDLRIYIDGTLQGTEPVTTQVSTGLLTIGTNKELTSPLTCHVALLRVWDIVLSASEISTSYVANSGVAYSGLHCLQRGLVLAAELLKDFPSITTIEDTGGALTTVLTEPSSNTVADNVPFSTEDGRCDTMGLTTVEYESTDVISGHLVGGPV